MADFEIYGASELLMHCKTWHFGHTIADSGLFIQSMSGGRPEYLKEFYCEYVPGIFSGKYEVLSCYACGNVVGVAVLKKDAEKREINIFFVLEEYRKAVAEELLNRSYTWLGTTNPTMTIQKGDVRFNYSKG